MHTHCRLLHPLARRQAHTGGGAQRERSTALFDATSDFVTKICNESFSEHCKIV